MKNKLINIFQGATLMILALSLTFIMSCKDDDDAMGGTPNETTLLSFGPSGVNHGDEIVFIGHHLDRVSSIVFRPEVEVTSDAFVSHSSTQITVAVPQAAEAGIVILNSSDGAIESKSVLSFEVEVEITSITGSGKPGTNLTISGDKINWIESVTFPADLLVEAADFVSQSQTEMVVQVPMEAQSGFLIFASGGTEPLTFAHESETEIVLPAISSLSPASIRHTADLTISGTDLDLVTEVIFTDGADGASVLAADFESQSVTEIVLSVPATTLDGTITLKQASPVDVVSTDAITIILPIGTDLTPSPAIPGTDDITITGTDLDLVAELIFPTYGSVLAADFVSHSATEIVVSVPEEATKGAIGYVTVHGFEELLGVIFQTPPTGGGDILDYYIYDDAVQNGWSEWDGWGHSEKDFANQENTYAGDNAIKVTFTDQWGAIQIGSPASDVLSGYKYMSFKVYAPAAQDLIFQIGDNADSYFSIPQGWSPVDLLIEEIDGNGSVGEIRIKNNNDALPVTLYIDEIGLRLGDPPPPPPDYYIYDDELQNSWSEWDGWGHDEKDFANQEQTYSGDNAIKVTYNDQWGAIQIGSPAADVFAGYSTLSFHIYAPAAQDFIIQIGDNADTYISIPQGWSQVELNIADIDGNDNVNELRFKNNNDALPVTLYIDEIGLYF